MRSRKEIMETLVATNYPKIADDLILEVLLDIRDLLKKKVQE